jgi:hypothetical protein
MSFVLTTETDFFCLQRRAALQDVTKKMRANFAKGVNSPAEICFRLDASLNTRTVNRQYVGAFKNGTEFTFESQNQRNIFIVRITEYLHC